MIRPQGAATVNVNQTVKFTARTAAQLKRETPPTAQQPTPSMPAWIWAAATALLAAMSFTIWKLTRRHAQPAA